MELFEVKYSLIGNFSELKATPDNYKVFAFLTTKYGFIPNQITVNSFLNTGVVPVQRIQFTKQEKNIRIDFLEERIDIVFNRLNIATNIEIDSTIGLAMDILVDIDNEAGVKGSRLAFYVSSVIQHHLKPNLINHQDYFPDKTFTEWDVRSVHRERIKLNNKSEEVNVVLEQRKLSTDFTYSVKGQQHKVRGTHCTYDINTVAKKKMDYFSCLHLSEFLLIIKVIYLEAESRISRVYI